MGIHSEAFKNPYWTNSMKMSWLQRMVIIHSIIYYEMDGSVISDRMYDRMSRDLVELMENSSDEQIRKTDYYYCMYDFDGNTGFDIRDRLTEYDREYLTCIASHIKLGR